MAVIENVTLSNNALKVLHHRYLLRDRNGRVVETPAGLFRRVAKAIAVIERKWGTDADMQKWETAFYEAMTNLRFLPNSPTLMNAGTKLNQLSACFVLPLPDHLDGIFTTLKQAALIQQNGGGTGFNFSHLRPKDDPLSITGGTASGPLAFMKVFDAATEHIKHGGKRRGANMGILNCDHPDIEEFVLAKKTAGVLNNFNISVGITDTFLQAVEREDNWPLLHPQTKQVTKTIKAAKLWEKITQNAWASGDPGLLFLDTINSENPLPECGSLEATNPCGEVPLLPFEACNLGSINVARFLLKNGSIDWDELENVIYTAVRFLDDVIDCSNYLFAEIKAAVQANRKIGLGIMGWADLLSQMQIPYDSEEALSVAQRLMQFIGDKSFAASCDLATERDCFPNWNKSIFHPHPHIRNATRLSIAPTGTISILANCSSSIEPLFALAYERRHVLNGQLLSEVNENLIEYLKEFDLFSITLLESIKATGSLQYTAVPEEVKRIYRTAFEISPEWHLKHQLLFQQYVDNAVSKTINLPETATVEEIDFIYRTAWQQKAKGITVYRNRSKNEQVLHTGLTVEEKACKVCVQ